MKSPSVLVATASLAAIALWLSTCTPSTPCGPDTCAGGCCDAHRACQPGTAPTACGGSGLACLSCAPGFGCVAGACAVVAGGGAGGGSGGGSGGGDALDAGQDDWGNTSGVVDGSQLGTGAYPNALLVKSIAALPANDAGLAVVSASLARWWLSTDESASLAVRVRNVSDTGACFFEADAINLVDGSGASLHDAGWTFLRGSLGDVTGVETDTCLRPGEDGYLFDFALVTDGGTLYSQTTGVSWLWRRTEWDGTLPKARMRPESYALVPDGGAFGKPSLRLAFRNTGSGPGAFSNFTIGVAAPLDAEGRVGTWQYLADNLQPATGPIAAGALGSIDSAAWVFEGSATRSYAHVRFEDCKGCLVSPPDLSSREGILRFHRALQESTELRRRAVAR